MHYVMDYLPVVVAIFFLIFRLIFFFFGRCCICLFHAFFDDCFSVLVSGKRDWKMLENTS